MNAAMGDILHLTNLWDVEHSSYVSLSLSLQTWEKSLRRVRGSCLGQSQERRDDLLHDVSEKNSRWLSDVKAICWVRTCLWLSTRWTCEIPKCWVHHHVNRNEDDEIASSEQQSWREDSRWFSCVRQWERRSVECTLLWTSTGERLKIWFFCLM